MLYITIILVASGLFLIVYSLFTSSTVKTYRPAAESPSDKNKGYLQAQEKEPETIEEFTRINTHKNSKIEAAFDTGSLNLNILDEDEDKKAAEIQDEKDWHAPELDDLKETATRTKDSYNDNIIQKNTKEARLSDQLKGISYSAILYEDSSNIFDYDNRNSIIDSTLKEYEKIKRIGKGLLELKDNCICFTAENKIYRYDFHRVGKIRGGNNYIALFLKKSRSAGLFILDKDSSIGIKLERIFSDYSRGAA